MRLTLEDNYYTGSVNTWTPISRSVSWDSKNNKDKDRLENDLQMIFEYLKQYQGILKYRADCVYNNDKMIPRAKAEHIGKLLEKYKPFYTSVWKWGDSL